jgi:hypothetical protein
MAWLDLSPISRPNEANTRTRSVFIEQLNLDRHNDASFHAGMVGRNHSEARRRLPFHQSEMLVR